MPTIKEKRLIDNLEEFADKLFFLKQMIQNMDAKNIHVMS